MLESHLHVENKIVVGERGMEGTLLGVERRGRVRWGETGERPREQ